MKDVYTNLRTDADGTFDATETTPGQQWRPAPTKGYGVQVHVPSITGTSPTLDIVFQESATLGGTYRRIATVEQITTAGDYPIRVYNKQPFVRAVLTLGGSSSPAFGSVHVGLDDGAHRNDLQSGDNL
jgi:hypothetical protein